MSDDRSEDPRFTAYALGEMSADERRAFEEEIAGDEEATREIAAIAAAAVLLRGEIATAPTSLGEAQRAAIEAALRERAAAPPGPVAPEAAKAPDVDAAADDAKVVPIDAARQRRAGRMRALFIAVPAVAAAAALLFVGQTSHREAAPASPHDGYVVTTSKGAARPSTAEMPLAQSEAAATAAPMAPGPVPPQPMRAMDGDSPHGAPGLLDGKAKPGGRAGEAKSPHDSDRPPSPGQQVAQPTGAPVVENAFIQTAADPRSTFSIDVDSASYTVARRTIEVGALPMPSEVRVEEMINYFPYADPAPADEAFSVTTDVAAAPWAKDHRLLRIGLKGREVKMAQRPASNLVFLLDVSGSMMGEDRLGLVKKGLAMLVQQLDERDRISIVVYAGASGLVLPPTPGNDKRTILDALERLEAGGGTNGGAGIELAYAQAAAHFVQGGSNRVILATDGDFNVGTSSTDALIALAQAKAKTGVFLTVLGFGAGNLNDRMLEQVADKGNGHYAYVDTLAEAKKVLVEQAAGTLLTIAKDVKIQVSFDPSAVKSFRLIGYDNRVLAHQDFKDDRKDAGDIGAGHSVTALYELVPVKPGATGHVADVALRFKMPDGTTSRQVDYAVKDQGRAFESASTDLRFGAAVAGFGMVLRGSQHRGAFGLPDAARIAEGALGDDLGGHRRGFITLVHKAEAIEAR